MKKFIFCFICLLHGSCACTITTTTLVADITTYTQNGEVLQKWERVVLQESINTPDEHITANSFKTFGVNFYDEKTKKYIIIGNAVPYIIEYTTENNTYVTNNTSDNNNQDNLVQEKNKLINQWKSLQVKEQTLANMMKGKDKKSIEYQNIKNQHNGVVSQMLYISNKLKDLFNYDILMQGF